MIDLEMGKYAAFVWPAWGISALALAALAVRAAVAARRWSAELKRLEGETGRPQAVRSTAGRSQ